MGNNVLLYLDDISTPHRALQDSSLATPAIGSGRAAHLRPARQAVRGLLAAPTPSQGSAASDMLANRADVWNLGDVSGKDDLFALSYIEQP